MHDQSFAILTSDDPHYACSLSHSVVNLLALSGTQQAHFTSISIYMHGAYTALQAFQACLAEASENAARLKEEVNPLPEGRAQHAKQRQC